MTQAIRDAHGATITFPHPAPHLEQGDLITIGEKWTFEKRWRAIRQKEWLHPDGMTIAQKLFWLFGYRMRYEIRRLFVITEVR